MSKYRAVPVVIDGRRFHSQKEGRRYRELLLLQKAGEIRDLECQVGFPIFVHGHKISVYVADFKFITPDGKIVVEDVKSPATAKIALYRIKKKLVKACYNIDILET